MHWTNRTGSDRLSSMTDERDTARDSGRRYSAAVVDGAGRTFSRAMLRATGFEDADFSRPILGVASTWSRVTPCNLHIDELAREAGRGIDESGGKAIAFGTITVSDGISMGTQGRPPGKNYATEGGWPKWLRWMANSF